ncbi:hypothetical protein TIFTF001_024499 [Ficus carica]|uniref:Uncharacterized protein n=1 Tax=Ficus carica TaxID=3494 RepID=A0AA88DGW5_FICCA|nr:hypothetical protein TIFTF001_024499 [Ficus carica]
MESITMGVPIGAWPFHSDQPRNTVLITKVLKVGTVVRDWSCRDEVAAAAMVVEGVKKLMASEEGEEMRKRAEELGGAVRRTVALLVWSLTLSLLISLDHRVTLL